MKVKRFETVMKHFFSVYNEILHHLRYDHGADDATQLRVLRNNAVGFVESFIHLFK